MQESGWQPSPALPPNQLPPNQKPAEGWPVRHYGPVPRFRPDTWRLTVNGATADGQEHHFDVAAFADLKRDTVNADLHCVSKVSMLDNTWEGVLARTLVDEVPPAAGVTHVMAWAEYGYSANMTLDDFCSARTVLATHRNGEALTPEHGWPLRLVVPHMYTWKGPKWLRMVEYMTADRRGFWEERGYHNHADPWQEERYSYME